MLCIIKLLQPIKLTLTRKWLKWCNDVVLADIYSLPSQTGYFAWWIYGDWIFFWKRRQQQWNRVSPSLAMWRLSNTSFLITMSFVLSKNFILHLFQSLWKIWLIITTSFNLIYQICIRKQFGFTFISAKNMRSNFQCWEICISRTNNV